MASLRFTLAYRGKLGLEEDAVIGKVFTPGEIKFNEEWDNGLIGNHTWLHTGDSGYDSNDPAVGYKVNRIEGDLLVKENVRYLGERGGHYNESFIGVVSTLPGDPYKDILPIPVTPRTYVEFKIDQMSIDPPPSSYVGCWQEQYLVLHFNKGLEIQYFQPGQYGCLGISPGMQIAYRTFSLGYVIIDNIYEAFRQANLSIPSEGLSLRYISVNQQLFRLGESAASDHKQQTILDFIRIVEGKDSAIP